VRWHFGPFNELIKSGAGPLEEVGVPLGDLAFPCSATRMANSQVSSRPINDHGVLVEVTSRWAAAHSGALRSADVPPAAG
jgi:hypothetical protein